MPRDLSDVLHYFMPELAPEADRSDRAPGWAGRSEGVRSAEIDHATEQPLDADSTPYPAPHQRPAALPIIGVSIGDRDVVRAAFSWNLAVEVARLGGRAVVLAPEKDDPSPLWPEAGIGPLGVELIPTPAENLGELYRIAIDTAVERADGAVDGGLVFVRVPPRWLSKPSDAGSLLSWMLLFTSSGSNDLRETYGIAKLLLGANPRARVGITIHGARRRNEAEEAFAKLARTTQRCLGGDLTSYGLLVDDLHVYRAIVAQRPIGLAHPQSPAARALRDVAQMLLDDARKRTVV